MRGGGVVGVDLSRLPPSAIFYILDRIVEDHGDTFRAWLAGGVPDES